MNFCLRNYFHDCSMFRRAMSTTSQKLGFFAKTKQQAQFIFKGIKIFTEETKEAQILKRKINNGNHQLTRREFVFVIVIN